MQKGLSEHAELAEFGLLERKHLLAGHTFKLLLVTVVKEIGSQL